MSHALSTHLAPTRRLGRAAVAVGGTALFVTVAAADGGYFTTSSNWIVLGLAWVAGIFLAFRGAPAQWTTAEVVQISGLVFLTALVAASPLWSDAASLSAVELQRVLALPLIPFLAAAFSIVPSRLALPVVVGISTVAAYSVLTRLLPERLGTFDPVAGYRLSEPLGYWNALGILCVIGILLALSLAAHTDNVALGGVAGVVPLLTVTLYFTFSRGAWIALALALAVAITFEPKRLRFLAAAFFPVVFSILVVLVASRYDALTTRTAELVEATRQGHRFSLWLVLLCAGAATAAIVWTAAAERVQVAHRTRRFFASALLLVALAAAFAGLSRFGAPWSIASNAYGSFTSPPPRVQNLNDRLFTFSSNGRIELWEAAWENYKDHPLTGSGAGTFEQYWLENRDVGLKVRDAHSLYLETLSELGPLGLALLLLALGVPVYAAFKARGHPLVPAAFGAYVAYLVHAGVDWDWEMPAVTLTALFIGASIVVAARKPEDEEKTMSPRLRYGLLAGTVALAAVAFVGLVGNMALAQSADEARAGDWDESESKARRAETWAPWSPEPWQRIGEAQLGRGELANARASFRKAIAKDERNWSLWLDLARASESRAQLAALAQATKLNPLSPELAQLRKELAELGTIEVGG